MGVLREYHADEGRLSGTRETLERYGEWTDEFFNLIRF